MNPIDIMSRFTVCTDCGKADCHLTIIDEVTAVCDQCLDSRFIQCDECGEYWDDFAVEFTYTEDDRCICEYCMENYEEDEIDFDE